MGLVSGWIVFFVAAYSVVTLIWMYVALVAVKSSGRPSETLLVRRLYLTLFAGAVCAIVCSIAAISDFVLNVRAGVNDTTAAAIVFGQVIPLVGNCGALAVIIVLVVRGWLPRLARTHSEQMQERDDLRDLVDARTEELRRVNETLERDIAERRAMEQKLTADHALLDTIMNTAVGAVCFVKKSGEITFANQTARSTLGVSAEMNGLRLDDLKWLHSGADHRPALESDRPYHRLMASAQPLFDVQLSLELADGSRRILSINGSQLNDIDANETAAVFLVTDITQRKNDEELLRNSEKRFRAMVENLPGGAVYVDGDQLFLNRAAEEITGFSRSELTTVMQWFWALYGQDNKSARSRYEEMRDAGFSKPYTSVIRRKDGEERTIEFHSYKSDHIIIWLLHDVTERYRAEEAVRASEQKYRLLAETARDVICIHDMEGNITYVNEAGLHLAELLRGEGETLQMCDVLSPGSRKRLLDQLERRLAGDKSRWLFEIEMNTLDGQTISFEINSAPIVANGKVTASLNIARDITERKQAEADRIKLETRVQHAQKLESLGLLAGGIANDFNNILMGIVGSADMAWHELPSDSGVRIYMQEIFRSVNRAADVCKHLMAFTGRDKYAASRIDVNALISDMLRLSRVSMDSNVHLDLKLEDNLPPMLGDSGQVGKAILNLVTNACDALGDREGNVSVSTSRLHCDPSTFKDAFLYSQSSDGEYYCVTVEDNGSGMDAETVSRMFDPFFSTREQGRGLGLSDVLGIVRGHGGAITVDSEPGKGTRIGMYFPWGIEPKADPDVHQNDLWTGSGTILVVDDEENVRVLTKRMLERLGFAAVLASSIDRALSESMPSLSAIILDLAMPDMDGETAFDRIRRVHPSTPIVMASGYSLMHVAEQSAQRDIAAFIQKPFQLHELSYCLRDALERSTSQPLQ